MSGLGTSPIGFSTPFGVGVATTVDPPPTTAPQMARYFDPVLRDYVLVADDGSYQRMPALRQRVLMAILETKGSSTVRPDDGVSIPQKIDASYERRVKSTVTAALAFLVNEGSLRIDSIRIEYPRPGANTITVEYTDLKTGLPDTATA